MSGTPFNAPMGEAVGELYVKRTFSPDAKAQMVRLVENLRAAYKARIAKLPWMTEDTKKAALRKLETMNVKIGYPDRWRDYSTLEIKVGDAFGNRQRESAFQRARPCPPGQRRRPQRLGYGAANGQRLLQLELERDRVPGGHPAAAVLRPERGPRRELRRHRRGHRPRDGSRRSTTREPSPTRRACCASGGSKRTSVDSRS